ncbi:hypothetical protein ACGYLM_01595 [Sulfitobacter sp. 1A10445]|uniref:hypothetical protein n=1 Tax=unclassified Sulfitobacter TaxID=196795 RepID=UPI0037465AE0
METSIIHYSNKNMEITDFTAIAVVGALLSVAIQFIKAKYGTTSVEAKLLTLALSIGFGGLYVLVQNTPYFETVILVLSSASAVYALLLKA